MSEDNLSQFIYTLNSTFTSLSPLVSTRIDRVRQEQLQRYQKLLETIARDNKLNSALNSQHIRIITDPQGFVSSETDITEYSYYACGNSESIFKFSKDDEVFIVQARGISASGNSRVKAHRCTKLELNNNAGADIQYADEVECKNYSSLNVFYTKKISARDTSKIEARYIYVLIAEDISVCSVNEVGKEIEAKKQARVTVNRANEIWCRNSSSVVVKEFCINIFSSNDSRVTAKEAKYVSSSGQSIVSVENVSGIFAND